MVLILRWQPTWDFEAEELIVHQLILWVTSEFVTGLGLIEKEMVVHQKVSWKNHPVTTCIFFEVRITQVTVNELLLLGTVLCHEMGLLEPKKLEHFFLKVGDLIVAHCFLRMLPIKKKAAKTGCSCKTWRLSFLTYRDRRLGDFCQEKGCCQFNKGSFRANSKEIEHFPIKDIKR